MISIHAPRVGSDDIAEQCYNIAKLNFNPRSPCGERPSDTTVSGRQSSRFQSTLPVWGATHISFGYRQGGLISIHAPRVGSDAVGKQRLRLDRNFNPRSPCGERLPPLCGPTLISIFQSTLPVWGATTRQRTCRLLREFQSTLPVWGATSLAADTIPAIAVISIHAPRVGSDKNSQTVFCGQSGFQSTLPVWGATSRRWSGGAQGEHFNPRSPCGERRQLGQRPAHSQPEFQSTLPVWGATGHPDQPAGNGHISIHAPRVGSDNLQVILDDNVATFQSTLPVWGATKDKDNLVGAINISIHAPRVGSDANVIDCYYRRRNFNPRSPCGERL